MISQSERIKRHKRLSRQVIACDIRGGEAPKAEHLRRLVKFNATEAPEQKLTPHVPPKMTYTERDAFRRRYGLAH